VDMRHNRVTAKGLHAIATFLKNNITLLDLLLSETEQLFIAGDELIIQDSLDSSSIIEQERRDKSRIEQILLSNRALSKARSCSCSWKPRRLTLISYLHNAGVSCISASRGRARRWI